MKVLLVHNSADIYGASRSLLRLSGRLPSLGFAPTILLPEEGPLAVHARNAGFPVKIQHSLRVIHRRIFRAWGLTRFFAGFPGAARETAKWLRQEHFSLVHTNLGTVVSSAWSARLAGVPHIWHIRDWFQEFGALWGPYSRYILASSAKVVCVSQPIAHQFPPSPKVCVLHNGLDLAEFPPVSTLERMEARRNYGFSENEVVVGTVGRIKFVRKGQEHLLRAARALQARGIRVRVLLAGGAAPGSENHIPQMKDLARSLGLERPAVFTGELPNARPAYAAMDIFVLPSAQPEPFGGVVLEAMALELPVVATGIGGSPEQVSPEVTGFLVPPADAQALADRLETLISARALRVRMGRAGRVKIATELSLDQTTAGIDKIYREALQKNP
jgi:glycosyltransferase involved in cell wall biosynthesis